MPNPKRGNVLYQRRVPPHLVKALDDYLALIRTGVKVLGNMAEALDQMPKVGFIAKPSVPFPSVKAPRSVRAPILRPSGRL